MSVASSSSSGLDITNKSVGVPDILLDHDRLHMLLDIICNDYLTASYASRENGNKVVFKALQKLYQSIHSSRVDVRDPVFLEKFKVFQDEFLQDLDKKRTVHTSYSSPHILNSPTASMTDETVVKDVLKPRLLGFIEDLCKEQDHHFHPRTIPLQPPSSNVPNWNLGDIRMEGWLRKKGQHVNLWRDRYFYLRSTSYGTHYVYYFRKKGDKEPRGWFVLGPGTRVDEVRESPSKIETKPLFTFRIHHSNHNDDAEEMTPSMNESPMATPGRTTSSFDFPISPGGEESYDLDPRTKKSGGSRFRSRATAAAAAATAATAVVLTGGLAGVGIGMVGMGVSAAAAASAGAAGAIMVQNRNKGPIALAAESLETALWWRNGIMECIAQAEEQWKQYINWYMDKGSDIGDESSSLTDQPRLPMTQSSGTSKPIPKSINSTISSLKFPRTRTGSFGTIPRSISKSFRSSATFSQDTMWKLYSFSSKLRVDVERSHLRASKSFKLINNGPTYPPALRTRMKVHASPKTVFDILMNMESSFYQTSHVIEEARVVDTVEDDHSDVVYWRLAPTYLWPVTVHARDLCLLRYWRQEQDSSYFICFQSTTHPKCPVLHQHVRGTVLGGGFIISPRHNAYDIRDCDGEGSEDYPECWVTLTIQMNPNGWIDSTLARSWYYLHSYGVYFLEMITSLSTINTPNTHKIPRPFPCKVFEQVSPKLSRAGGLAPFTPSQIISTEINFPMLEPFRTDLWLEHPLPMKFWSEPHATSFFVRGPQYMTTMTKIRSIKQPCRLIGVEVLRAQEPIHHIALSSFDPSALSMVCKGATEPFIFIINFQLPGPPYHSLILYFTPENPSELKKNSIFADMCHDLLRGESDTYRTKRLKVIPRVVQGTWLIREGVGTTPVILGTKVSHQYYRGSQYLEVDYDISSSTVATALVNMIMGYARELVIDLAFVIEAQSSSELPERVLGCVRLNCIDLRDAAEYRSRNIKSVGRL